MNGIALNAHQLRTALSLVENSTTKVVIKRLQDGVFAWREDNPKAGSVALNELQACEWPFELSDKAEFQQLLDLFMAEIESFPTNDSVAVINESLTVNKTKEAEGNSRWTAVSPWLG